MLRAERGGYRCHCGCLTNVHSSNGHRCRLYLGIDFFSFCGEYVTCFFMVYGRSCDLNLLILGAVRMGDGWTASTLHRKETEIGEEEATI